MKILSKLNNTGMIEEVADKRYVTDAEKLAWNGKADKTYVDSQDSLKADKTYVDNKVKTDVPVGAKFTDTITTINGKTGTITKSDITALGIPAQDTVVDISGKADKTYVDNKVKTDVPFGAEFTDTKTTINGKTGAISKADIVALGIPAQDTVYTHPTGTNPHGTTKSDVGLSNVDNIKQASKTEFDEHLADGASHGIGNKSTLLTTNKSTIVDAINEVFQSGNNVKSDTVDALLSVDNSLPITSSSAWQNIINSIGDIKSDIKTAELAGINWTQRTSSFGGISIIYGVTYGQGMFVAVGDGGKLATSTDGITWTQRTSSFGYSIIYGVTYGQGMFVAVGALGKLATSTDGITWTQRTSSFGSSVIYGVTYGQGMFVAVGALDKLATSTDGITWTQRTSSFGGISIIRGVTYGQGMFVAVGGSGKLATSPNGTTWTQRTNSFGSSAINEVGYGQGMFVAVGDNGKLATSTDGITWTERTISFGNIVIYGVGYGQGMFVAVDALGKLATSTDGITWTQRTSSFGSSVINGVGYGQGMFVAVGSSGKLATSRNLY